VGSLTHTQSKMFLELLFSVGVYNIDVINPHIDPIYGSTADTLRLTIKDDRAAAAMCIVTNFSPDSARNLGRTKFLNESMIEIWWD